MDGQRILIRLTETPCAGSHDRRRKSLTTSYGDHLGGDPRGREGPGNRSAALVSGTSGRSRSAPAAEQSARQREATPARPLHLIHGGASSPSGTGQTACARSLSRGVPWPLAGKPRRITLVMNVVMKRARSGSAKAGRLIAGEPRVWRAPARSQCETDGDVPRSARGCQPESGEKQQLSVWPADAAQGTMGRGPDLS